MNLTRARAVTTGYMNDPELEWLADQASRHSRIVEVGSWTGRSTLALIDNTPGTVTAVDTWEGSANGDLTDILEARGKHWAWEEFKKNTFGSANLVRLDMESVRAAGMYERLGVQFDMIFIDASHDYESVKADILAWMGRVEEGGLLCGHDYTTTREHCAGVVKAVDELLPDRQLMTPNDGEHSIWWVILRNKADTPSIQGEP